jgi:hypothetical protein
MVPPAQTSSATRLYDAGAMLAARTGGGLAVVVSVGLTVHATAIGELNPTAAGVFLLAAGSGLLAVHRPARPGSLMVAALVLLVTLIPAAFSPLIALLYLPSLALIGAAAVLATLAESRRG